MRRHLPYPSWPIALLTALLAGCTPQQPFYLSGNKHADDSHYVGMTTAIEYPDLNELPSKELEGTLRPMSLANSEAKEIWNLTLEDAVRNALENSKVLRSIGGSVQGPPGFITQFSDNGNGRTGVPTIYDPSLVESNPAVDQGVGGPDAALSLFDAQLSSGLYWEKNHTPQNVSPAFESYSPTDFAQDTAQFQTTITKYSATGAQYSAQSTVGYDMENSTRAFPADWTANFQVQISQPLLQGAGVEFNRIAGPGATPGMNRGVMVARLRGDIALTEFEESVLTLVNDVENTYWELYFAYRNLNAAVAGRNSALETWRKVHALYLQGARGGEADKEAQSREQYFLFYSTVQSALGTLYSTERKLRYLMGLTATDGRLIRPADEPTTAKITFDWAETQSEAICRNVKLREERWRVKQRELELVAAKNYLLPRLDAVARYTWSGMGEDLTGATTVYDPTNSIFGNAFGNVLDGQFQSWHMGFQASIPLGFRKEMAGVRYAQLNIARERAILQEAELEVSHQLAYAISDLENNLAVAQTNFNRLVAATNEVDSTKAAYETGGVTLDLLLEAQRTLAQAESDYFRSLVSYNQAIAQVHYRKGSLLEYNGVYLAEGPWPGKAYFDARRRARARDAAHYLNYGFTAPQVISRGPVQQFTGAGGAGAPAAIPNPEPQTPAAAPDEKPEIVPTPAPAPEPSQAKPSGDSLQPPPPAAQPNPEADRHDGGWQAAPKAPQTQPADKSDNSDNAKRTAYESDANPSPVESNQPAPGWKGIQH